MLLLAAALALPPSRPAAPVVMAPIADARPTQMTIGFREARLRARELAKVPAESRDEHMRERFAPAVLGPAGGVYVLDRHHLLSGAERAGYSRFFYAVEHDFRSMSPERFWGEMERRGLVHPYDEEGRRRPVSRMPARFAALGDDVYRSVASSVRRKGGFDKSPLRYAEFEWADFFRQELKADPREDYGEAVKEAAQLARSNKARGLPGWRGR